MMSICIADASSAILLYKTKLFEVFLNKHNVAMPRSVYNEITRSGYTGADDFIKYNKNNKINILDTSSKHENFSVKLDEGERDVIIQYNELLKTKPKKNLFILVDDGRCAQYCKKNFIPYINALLVPKILFFSNVLSEQDLIIHEKKITSIGRYSDKVLCYAKNCTANDLDYFL